MELRENHEMWSNWLKRINNIVMHISHLADAAFKSSAVTGST